MLDYDAYFADIDANRARRAKELSEIRAHFGTDAARSVYGVRAKAVIVLSYAHWEGFYNDCVSFFLRHLEVAGTKVTDVSWSMLVGLLRPQLQSLRDRNHSSEAEVDFVDMLKQLIDDDFSDFDSNVVFSRSNLDFSRLRHNFRVLGFDIAPFQKWRLRIDRELVGWRHGVAHGDSPDLQAVDVKNHIEFTQELLLVLADVFQEQVLLGAGDPNATS